MAVDSLSRRSCRVANRDDIDDVRLLKTLSKYVNQRNH